MNMFQKKPQNSSEIQSSVKSTGISIKDRQSLFGSKEKSDKRNSTHLNASNNKMNFANTNSEHNNNINNSMKYRKSSEVTYLSIKSDEIKEEIKGKKKEEIKQEKINKKTSEKTNEKAINRYLTQNINNKEQDKIKNEKIIQHDNIKENKGNSNKKLDIRNSGKKEFVHKNTESDKKININNKIEKEKMKGNVIRRESKTERIINIKKTEEKISFVNNFRFKDEWEYDDDSNGDIEHEKIYDENFDSYEHCNDETPVKISRVNNNINEESLKKKRSKGFGKK